MKKIISIVVTTLFFACNNSPVEKPDNLLSKEEMTNIIYDVMILQASKSYNNVEVKKEDLKIESYIFDKYKIDSSTYHQNQRYYASKPKEYEKMYKEVVERLTLAQQETDTLLKKEKRSKKDKINDENLEVKKKFEEEVLKNK